MVGWRKLTVWTFDVNNVVVLVDADACWLRVARLNLANDGEHEPRYDRLSTSAGGRGSCRGKQRSRSAARGDAGEIGNRAADTIGIMMCRDDRNVGRCVGNKLWLRGGKDDTSLHGGLLLADVHVEEKLELAGSCRRRAPIIIILFFNLITIFHIKIYGLHLKKIIEFHNSIFC